MDKHECRDPNTSSRRRTSNVSSDDAAAVIITHPIDPPSSTDSLNTKYAFNVTSPFPPLLTRPNSDDTAQQSSNESISPGRAIIGELLAVSRRENIEQSQAFERERTLFNRLTKSLEEGKRHAEETVRRLQAEINTIRITPDTFRRSEHEAVESVETVESSPVSSGPRTINGYSPPPEPDRSQHPEAGRYVHTSTPRPINGQISYYGGRADEPVSSSHPYEDFRISGERLIKGQIVGPSQPSHNHQSGHYYTSNQFSAVSTPIHRHLGH